MSFEIPSRNTSTILGTDLIPKANSRGTDPLAISFDDFITALGLVGGDPYTAPIVGITPVVIAALPQSLSGPGAISITTPSTNFTSGGVDDALTLIDGTQVGQLLSVVHVVDGGSGILTPTTFADGVTITFTGVGEVWDAIWTISGWQTIGLRGATLPVIA
jgi:hypothetical protein